MCLRHGSSPPVYRMLHCMPWSQRQRFRLLCCFGTRFFARLHQRRSQRRPKARVALGVIAIGRAHGVCAAYYRASHRHGLPFAAVGSLAVEWCRTCTTQSTTHDGLTTVQKAACSCKSCLDRLSSYLSCDRPRPSSRDRGRPQGFPECRDARRLLAMALYWPPSPEFHARTRRIRSCPCRPRARPSRGRW